MDGNSEDGELGLSQGCHGKRSDRGLGSILGGDVEIGGWIIARLTRAKNQRILLSLESIESRENVRPLLLFCELQTD